MRVVLDVTRNADGVLNGSAGWTTDDHTLRFHGVLELIAAVESALAEDAPPAIAASVADPSSLADEGSSVEDVRALNSRPPTRRDERAAQTNALSPFTSRAGESRSPST